MSGSNSSIKTSFNSLKLETTARVDVEELICTWKLNVEKNSGGIMNSINYKESPVFAGSGKYPLGFHSWKMHWGLDSRRNYYTYYADLVSVDNDNKQGELNVSILGSLCNSAGKSEFELKKDTSNVTFTKLRVGNSYTVLKIYAKEFQNEINGYFPNNFVTATCKILVRSEINTDGYTITNRLKYTPAFKNDRVLQTMNSMWASSNFSDIKLVTLTKTFPAHKNILSTLSPVFDAMFRSKIIESKSDSVEITDFDEAAVKGMLEHVYTGQVSDFEEKAINLLRISDKYQLLDLRGECEEFLSNNLKIEIAVEALEIATLMNAATLKASAEKFIKRNFQKMNETESLKNLIKTNPEVLIGLLSDA